MDVGAADGAGSLRLVLADAPMITAQATAYCQGGTTASGRRTRWGYVAQNTLRLGTLIVLRRPVAGRRRFRVMDRIGHGSQLDVFMTSCSAAVRFGRRTLRYRVA